MKTVRTKKSVFAIVIICIVCSLLASTTVMARYTYTRDIKTTLSISSSGTATATGNITGYQGTTTKVQIILYLQQYKDGKWQDVTSWTQTFNNYKGTLEDTYSTVQKGYKYRVKSSYYAYCGNDYENVIDYSGEISY